MRKLMLAAIAALAMAGAPARADDNLNFYFLYVGQGDMTLIECPGSQQFIMVDAGTAQDSAGAKANIEKHLPGLIKAGNSVEFVLTHDHRDHKNLATFVEGVVKQIGATISQSGPINDAVKTYSSGEVKVTNACGTANPGVEVSILHAKANSFTRDNNDSTVMRVGFGGYSALLMGDAEAQVEAAINYWGTTNLIKIGHHGSRTSSTETFIKSINPTVAIITAGRHNTYFHPRCATMATLSSWVVGHLGENISNTLFCYDDDHRDTSNKPSLSSVQTNKAILATRPFNTGETYNHKVVMGDGFFQWTGYDQTAFYLGNQASLTTGVSPGPIPDSAPGDDDPNDTSDGTDSIVGTSDGKIVVEN